MAYAAAALVAFLAVKVVMVAAGSAAAEHRDPSAASHVSAGIVFASSNPYRIRSAWAPSMSA